MSYKRDLDYFLWVVSFNTPVSTQLIVFKNFAFQDSNFFSLENIYRLFCNYLSKVKFQISRDSLCQDSQVELVMHSV